jgi:broad specificity phosphatase PhoE
MRTIELRRHTASDGDRLTADGIRAAVEIGELLAEQYDLLISSGAQRATQTLACFLAGRGRRFPAGVDVDQAFRSSVEDRWFAAAKQSGGGGLDGFLKVDPDLVKEEADRFGSALRRVFDALPDGGRALVVGHSPMHEVAVYGITGTIVPPISKGAGVLLVQQDGEVRVVAGPSISLQETIGSPAPGQERS